MNGAGKRFKAGLGGSGFQRFQPIRRYGEPFGRKRTVQSDYEQSDEGERREAGIGPETAKGSEVAFRTVFEQAPIGISITRQDGSFVYVNRQLCELFGYGEEELRGLTWKEVTHPEDLESSAAMLAQLYREPAGCVDWEKRYLHREGQVIWARIRASLVRGEEGAGWYFVGHIEDITAKRLAQQAIREAEAFAQATIDALPSHVCVLSECGELVAVNQAWRRFAGQNRGGTARGNGAPDWVGEGANYLEVCERVKGPQACEAARFASGIRAVLRGEREEYSQEYPCHAPGEQRWFLGKVTRFFSHGARRVLIEHINITETKLAAEAIERGRAAAQEANDAKSRFLANMSHELRTPMNGVMGMTQLLLDTGLSSEQRRYAEVVQASGQTLLTLIEDILDHSRLDHSRLDAREVELEEQEFDLRGLVEDAVEEAAAACGRKLPVEARVGAEIPARVRGDARRVRQVLGKLLANAVKFTQRGGIAVDAEARERADGRVRVRIAVTDSGIGIRADQRERLFAPFVQADVSSTRRFGGSGLGLAICKQLVERMGGEIGVESEEGRGSSFWFTLAFGVAPASVASSGGAQPERILVVEDHPINRALALAQLRKLGFQAEAVPTGGQALAAVAEGGFDLVLMDCQMPEMDGFEATRQIRGSLHSEIPIIALTADAMPADRERCLAEGMNDYLSKPLDLVALAHAIDRWLP